MARRNKRGDDEAPEPNLIAVLNVMFLLIPALLMAMEVASFAAVNVSPPLRSQGGEPPPSDAPDPLHLHVRVLEDGFSLSAEGQQLGMSSNRAIGRELDRTSPGIELLRPGAPLTDYGRYDYATLEAEARRLKALFPHETVVTVSAENTIPLQSLIMTMDALRGSGCELANAHDGEEVPPECYFWQPVVDGGRA